MYKLKQEQMHKIAPLFDGWEETMIWSCVQGCMGNAWADDLTHPVSAQIITGDFCFLGGQPNAELVRHIPEDFPSACILMASQGNTWADLIERAYGDDAEKCIRYAIKKEPDVFDHEKLRANVAALSPAYTIEPIDEHLYHKTRQTFWSRDLCSQFPTYEDYKARGLGFVALCGGIPVAGASSYTVYNGGIEIEVDTKESVRRQGLALACASKLILSCLDCGLYPSWDAANIGSVRLAEKLGYHFDREYVTYAITP